MAWLNFLFLSEGELNSSTSLFNSPKAGIKSVSTAALLSDFVIIYF